MKIRIETIKNLNETEIVIRCPEIDDKVLRIQQALVDVNESKLALVRDGKEYFLPTNIILFFETVDNKTYAHSSKNIFTSKHRLYELEKLLPPSFVRVGKSTIINTGRVLSITRNLTGPSLVHFQKSHKQINVSRGYYKNLRDKLTERS